VQHLNAELAGMQQAKMPLRCASVLICNPPPLQAQNIKQDAEVQKLKQQLQQLEVRRVGSGFRLTLIQRWVMSGLHPNLLSGIKWLILMFDCKL
jgi:hypothetical protein